MSLDPYAPTAQQIRSLTGGVPGAWDDARVLRSMVAGRYRDLRGVKRGDVPDNVFALLLRAERLEAKPGATAMGARIRAVALTQPPRHDPAMAPLTEEEAPMRGVAAEVVVAVVAGIVLWLLFGRA